MIYGGEKIFKFDNYFHSEPLEGIDIVRLLFDSIFVYFRSTLNISHLDQGMLNLR